MCKLRALLIVILITSGPSSASSGADIERQSCGERNKNENGDGEEEEEDGRMVGWSDDL